MTPHFTGRRRSAGAAGESRPRVLRFAPLLISLGLVPNLPADPGGHGTFPAETIEVGKTKREFRLVVPRTVDLRKPTACVFAFHGLLIDSKDLMPVYTGLNKLAAEKGFILVYPEAIGKAWGIAPDKTRADLAFFDVLLGKIGKRYKIDPARVFALGMSNGGYFAQFVAKERSLKVAAVCTHSGPLGLEALLGIRAARKFPVMIINGEDDPLFPPKVFRDNRKTYEKEGHTVTHLEIPDLGHRWAAESRINEKIWTFFEANPIP